MSAYPHDFDHVFAPLRGAKVADVRLAGCLDHDDPRDEGRPCAVPLAGPVYLVVEDREGATGWIRCEALGGGGQLSLRRVDRPEFPAVLDPQDDEFVLISVGAHYLGDHDPTHVVRVRYLLDEESDLTAGTVRAAEIEFGYGSRLLIDPGYFWGTRLQGAGAYEKLRAEIEERRHPSRGPVEAHTWTP